MRRHAAAVYATCLRVTRNVHDAEDATQVTFLTLAMQVKAGKPVNTLGPIPRPSSTTRFVRHWDQISAGPNYRHGTLLAPKRTTTLSTAAR